MGFTIEEFAARVRQDTAERLGRDYPAYSTSMLEHDSRVSIHYGRKYARVDVGESGKYMIDQAGNIYGIKAYGVPHLGKRFGSLETVDIFYWGGYYATAKGEPCAK